MAAELRRAQKAVSDGHAADSMQFIAIARDLARQLGFPRAEASTFRAIFAVVKRSAYSSDKEAWEAHGAKPRTYQQWKALIEPLEPQAMADGFLDVPSIGFAMMAIASPRPSEPRAFVAREKHGASDSMYELDKYAAAALAQPRNEGAGAFSTAYAMCATFVTSASRRVRSSSATFDEYSCTEKIDRTRLTGIVNDLHRSRAQRDEAIRRLERDENPRAQEQLKQLVRCRSLESVAAQLLTILPKSVDASYRNGRASLNVQYEERDAAAKGRLFATGQSVRTGEDVPRVVSLQGMQNDLRAALVGEFAHDIDCENSEFRLIWSLAKRYGHQLNVIESYCTHRQVFLDRIVQAHGVDLAAAKRLPNIIASGGQYRTWMRQHDVTSENGQLRALVSRMHEEIRVLHDDLVRRNEFAWLDAERQHMRDSGKREPFNLMPAIVRSSERKVLQVVHRCFFEHQWDVLALVFDGLIAEPREKTATKSLVQIMQLAEHQCLQTGWIVKLVEKPLYGLQDAPVKTIVDAYCVVREACSDLGPLFTVGEVVYISGYTTARIEEYVQGGQYDGLARVRYDDGSTYHVKPQVMCPPEQQRTVVGRTGLAIERSPPTVEDEAKLAAPGSGYLFLGLPEHLLEDLPPLRGPLVVAPTVSFANDCLLSGNFHTLVITDDELGYAYQPDDDACILARRFYTSGGRICVFATMGIFSSPANVLGPLFGCNWKFCSYTKYELVLTSTGASYLGGRAGGTAIEYTKANFLTVPRGEALLKPKGDNSEAETPIAIHRASGHGGQLMWLGFVNYGFSAQLSQVLSKLLRRREPRASSSRDERPVDAVRRAMEERRRQEEEERRIAEERRRKAEEERKRQAAAQAAAEEAERQRKAAAAEAERQRKAVADLARRRKFRGVECEFSIGDGYASDHLMRRSNSLETVTHLTLVGKGFFIARENGGSFWTGLPTALHSRLEKKDLNTQGSVQYVAAGHHDQYYAQVGSQFWWSGTCSDNFGEAVKDAAKSRSYSISRVAFGPHRSWIVVYSDGSSAWEGIPTELDNKLRSRNPRLPKPVEVALGQNESWYVKFADGKYNYSLLSEVARSFEAYTEAGWQVNNVLLNSENGDWALRYS